MGIEVDTKDCTALSDAELAEMADMCTDGPAGFELGFLSKQPDAWVLVTQAREGGDLVGFSFCTLERIGGTPSLLVGVASVKRCDRPHAILAALMGDQYRRAVLAFPDEDVLVGTRMIAPDAYQAFFGLEDVVPRPGHKASGEERAWGRRLAKRFGAEGRIDDRSFVLAGNGSVEGLLDYEATPGEAGDGEAGDEMAGLQAFFDPVDPQRHDCLVAFGWAMAEDLAAGRLGK